jgi:S-formylglutathione hydrolase FrmB
MTQCTTGGPGPEGVEGPAGNPSRLVANTIVRNNPGMIRRVVVGSLVLAALVTAPVRSGADGLSFADADGIHVVSVQQLDDRLWALSVESPALGRPVRVRILLPSDYATSTARYPVLYLFHGTSGGAPDWTTRGDAEATTAGRPLIVVMPDAGFDDDGGSWFTNWVDTATKLGPSEWETFHIDQLIPWVDANLRTIASRAGRAIAGLSQGGFGAMSYAARHPDMFAVAASFSGAPEIDRDAVVIPFSTAVVEAIGVYLDGVPYGSIFGDRLTDEINWRGHDPATLLTNLRGMSLYMWTATGLPGKYDSGVDLAASGIEAITHESTMLFHQHLNQAHIPSHYYDYVFGTHTFAYWAQDLREFIGPLMSEFAHPPAVPSRVDYESIDATWTQWGWTVQDQRRAAQAFTKLIGADPAGFALRGLGTADVTTPDAYPPGSTHAVTIGTRHTAVTADTAGALHITVPLGRVAPATTHVVIG